MCRYGDDPCPRTFVEAKVGELEDGDYKFIKINIFI